MTTACPEDWCAEYRIGKGISNRGNYYIRKGISRNPQVLLKAQDIVSELICSLDMEVEMSGQLYALYDFLLNCLIEGNIKKDSSVLQHALGIVCGLREAWESALISVRQIKYGK